MNIAELSTHLGALTGSARIILIGMPASWWEQPYPGSSGWTRSEVAGHLIDSAINNQQRFCRALIDEELHFPGYEQGEMVRVQRYRQAPVPLLIELWSQLNRYIAYLLQQIPSGKLQTRCIIGSNSAITLIDLALDYVAHLEHHLKQIAGKDSLKYSNLAWPPSGR
jgi:DinB superfamily